MHVLLEIDVSLYLLLFVIAGCSGLLVRIDQWVEGDFSHPRNDSGKLDIWRAFWSYILIFVLSGAAGTMVAMGTGYFLENNDPNILIFVAIMIGAIGKLIFYKLVEWVHDKFNDNVSTKKTTGTAGTSRTSRSSRRK